MALQLEQLKFFAKFIEKELGIIYSDSNYFQLEHRLEDLTAQLGMKNIEELWQKAKLGIEGTFKAVLLDLATNNETSFFRDVAIFNSLENMMLPDLTAKSSSLKEVRIWSAACSSGQEPYSIAITLQQARNRDASLPDYLIYATDFSDRMLERVKSRTYSQLEVQRGLSSDQLNTFFESGRDPNTWVFKNSIPSTKFHFQKINLLNDWYFDKPFHVIFCRNVLIYQEVENKVKVIEKMHKCLEPGGFLVLGAAESMLGVSEKFEQIQHANAVFYKKKK